MCLKNFVQATSHFHTHKHTHTHTCICFQKNESIFNPKNLWEQITCGMCEIFWWELSWTSPDFFWVLFFLYFCYRYSSQSWAHMSSSEVKKLQDAVTYIGFCTALKNVANFQFLASDCFFNFGLVTFYRFFLFFDRVLKCVQRGQPCFRIYQYHMVPQGTTNSTWSCPQPWIFG